MPQGENAKLITHDSFNTISNTWCVSPFIASSRHNVVHSPSIVALDSFSSIESHSSGTGLKNVGNTCYVNSLLQTYFHLLPFRSAVYSIDGTPHDTDTPREKEVKQCAHHSWIESVEFIFRFCTTTRSIVSEIQVCHDLLWAAIVHPIPLIF